MDKYWANIGLDIRLNLIEYDWLWGGSCQVYEDIPGLWAIEKVTTRDAITSKKNLSDLLLSEPLIGLIKHL